MNNDLISREALKKHKVYSEERHEYVVPVYNIDNATEGDWKFYYNHGYKQAERDLKRPQGEWIETHIVSCGKILQMRQNIVEHKCKSCGRWSIQWCGTITDRYCSYCGADMRKGGEEE